MPMAKTCGVQLCRGRAWPGGGRDAFLIGGGLLLLAVEDVLVDGERLEGIGVAPTIEVQAGPAPVGGDDPQFNRALAVLSAA
jgi:carboxyl-terminal processing protease